MRGSGRWPGSEKDQVRRVTGCTRDSVGCTGGLRMLSFVCWAEAVSRQERGPWQQSGTRRAAADPVSEVPGRCDILLRSAGTAGAIRKERAAGSQRDRFRVMRSTGAGGRWRARQRPESKSTPRLAVSLDVESSLLVTVPVESVEGEQDASTSRSWRGRFLRLCLASPCTRISLSSAACSAHTATAVHE